jgi:hypothetical protein
MPVEELATRLREILAEANGAIPRPHAHFMLAERLQAPVAEPDFEAASQWLADRHRAAVGPALIQYADHDCPELDLYSFIEHEITQAEFRASLGLQSESTIIERTHIGGAQSTGQWSRPDFTLATIRRWTYDPQKRLDIIALEAKCRSGVNVAAVFESLAHTRFAHYACVVLPRPTRGQHSDADRWAAIRAACSAHGIGLLAFDLEYRPIDGTHVGGWQMEIAPERHSPDPQMAQKFIEDRFTPAHKDQLARLASQ